MTAGAPNVFRRASLAAFDWISSTRDDVPPPVRQRMLETMLDRKTTPVVASICSLVIAILAIWTLGATWPWIWIAVDLPLTAARIAVLVATERALGRGETGYLDIAAWISLICAVIMAAGCSACIASGEPVLAVLAVGNLAGTMGNMTSPYSVTPRFGFLVLAMMAALLAAGMILSPFRMMAIAALQPAFALAGLTFVLRQNYRLALRMSLAEHETMRLARTDTLTGLRNRLDLQDHLATLEVRLKQSPSLGFALLSIDLDGFKEVNDTFGHSAGDVVLRSVARRLTNSVRPQDRVYRMGGDEFVIVLAGAKAAEAAFIAKRVITAIARPFDLGSGSLARIGASIGSAVAPENGATVEAVLSRSDAALYDAKRAGRGMHLADADMAG